MIGAVDIGGTKIAVGVVDADGQVLAKAECPTDVPLGFDAAMQRVSELLIGCRDQVGAKLEGIGIGCTGPVDPLTGLLGEIPTLPGWAGNPVIKLSDRFQLSVAIENDADAAALGEAAWGSGKGKARLICVTIGTGIGVSGVLDGKVYRGVAHSHPEIGHNIIEASGPPSPAGRMAAGRRWRADRPWWSGSKPLCRLVTLARI